MFRKHPIIAKIALLGLSLAAALLVVEGMVRVAGFDHPLMWRPDPIVGWWHIPGSSLHWTDEGDAWVHINRLGIRDPERTLEKPAGTLRIAVFGDSMTEGVQVDVAQTFTQRLERRLTARLRRRVEVLNFGVNGYSPLQGYLLYKTHGKAFQPDIVLHAVFLDNDVADMHEALTSGQRGSPFVADAPHGELQINYAAAEESFRSYNQEPIATVRRASAIYRMLSDARYRRLAFDTAVTTRTASGGIPRRYLLYADPAPPEWNEAWQRLETVVAAFAAEVAKDKRRYVMISVPAGQVVDEDAWTETLQEFPPLAKKYKWNPRAAEERFSRLAAEGEIPLIAPLDDFVRSAHRRTAFFGRVGHFTPTGHQLMAEALEKALLTRALLP